VLRNVVKEAAQEVAMTWNGQKLFEELEANGWTIYRIATLLDRKWDTVNRWRFIEPKFSDAQAILTLHAEVVKTTISS
jgi:hypothetical protein